MRFPVPVIAMLTTLAVPSAVSAQETQVAPAGHLPPMAEIEQVVWLEGTWEGTGIGDNLALESWLPPAAGTMVGTFVQTGDDGGIQFTEHMYLMEEGGSLVLRIKHFNPDLTGWEEKDEMLTFRLVAIEGCAAFFQALTLRCDGPDGLVAAVRMRSEGDEINELVFRFTRAGTHSAGTSFCADAVTTPDMNQCYAGLLSQAETRRGRYLAEALDRWSDYSEIATMIRTSDAAFSAYRDAECDGIAAQFGRGTIRGVMRLTCLISMTDRHTHTLWQHWITYADSTPPPLPEPEPLL